MLKRRVYTIAIIGAGTAGLAAAALLQQDGHDVTLYEKFIEPKPVGAGLLLQPTGLAVLARLGLDQDIIECGSVVRQLYGKVAGRKMATLDVAYADFAPHLFGVGSTRGALFSALYSKAQRMGVRIVASQDIVEVRGKEVVNAAGDLFGPYDLIIDGSGARSALRNRHADVKLNKPYPYGAIWSIVKVNDSFRLDTLEQRYKRAYHMIGLLPVGNDETQTPRAAFFWSMRVADYAAWRAKPLEEWKHYVASLWPEAESVLAQFTQHDDLMLAQYSDVILRKFYNGSLVFIGDAAHCTSPQLGQGANLALVDAMVLSECIAAHDSIEAALAAYNKARRSHVRFYQMASRALTPFFQSDSLLFAKLRFFTCNLACKIPLTRRIGAKVLSGTQVGLFSALDPGQWSPGYALNHNMSHPS